MNVPLSNIEIFLVERPQTTYETFISDHITYSYVHLLAWSFLVKERVLALTHTPKNSCIARVLSTPILHELKAMIHIDFGLE